ncbi:hypothetical protein C0992_002795 [Termitomyces sp. T32_za158]|nr:hypothetical protein C0992_002795 [Termitomyces sp. T32_za158]
MNYDVNDPEKGIQSDTERDYSRSLLGRQRNNILSRIRNFNISSIGSAFSGSLSAISSYVAQEDTKINYGYDTWNYANDLESGRAYEDAESLEGPSHAIRSSSATQTRSNSPLQTQSQCLSETKGFLNHARFCDRNSMNTSHVQQIHRPLYAPSVYDWGETSGTPPLTPDSFENVSLPSSLLPGDYHNDLKDEYGDEESSIEWNRSRSDSSEIKEGKRPDRSFGTLDDSIEENHGSQKSRSLSPVAVYDDRDEWYGLDYTLELSRRERLPSDTKSAGEHSKSHESWAAIHRGTIHPFLEDEDYYQWKNWHRYLDRQDERKKYKRGLEFKARSKDLACLYVDEMHTRDLLYWQKEVYGVVAKEVEERLHVLTQHRPDPYSPRKIHNFGWYLKRSLSVACLRELCPLPSAVQPVRSLECSDPPDEELCVDAYILSA